MGIIKIKKQASEMIFIHKYPIYDDASLSFKAKGILTYLVGHSNNWETRVEDLEKHSTDGKASIRAGLEELRSSGYAKLTEVREKGKYVDWDWEVCEMPIFQEEATAFNAKQAQKVKTRKATPKKPVNQASQPDSDFRILDTKPSPDAENRNLVKHRKKPVNQASQPDSDFPEVVNRYYTKLRKNETKRGNDDEERVQIETPVVEPELLSSSSFPSPDDIFSLQEEFQTVSDMPITVNRIRQLLMTFPQQLQSIQDIRLLFQYVKGRRAREFFGYATITLKGGWQPTDTISGGGRPRSDWDTLGEAMAGLLEMEQQGKFSNGMMGALL